MGHKICMAKETWKVKAKWARPFVNSKKSPREEVVFCSEDPEIAQAVCKVLEKISKKTLIDGKPFLDTVEVVKDFKFIKELGDAGGPDEVITIEKINKSEEGGQ